MAWSVHAGVLGAVLGAMLLLELVSGKELVETLFSATGDCVCPSPLHDCSLYCVGQAQCGTMDGFDPSLCYLIDEPLLDPASQCTGGKLVANHCIIPLLEPPPDPNALPPEAEWCHLMHNSRPDENFNFEAAFLESNMAAISRISTYHADNQWDNSVMLAGWKMEFGGVTTAETGRTDAGMQSGECVLAEGEYVNAIIFDTKSCYGVIAPAAVTFVTSAQTCGPYGPEYGIGSATYSGQRLLYIRGYMGAVNDDLEMVFAGC